MTTKLRRGRTLNELLRDAFALTVANWRVLTIVAIVVTVPVEGAVLGLGLGWFGAGYSTLSTSEVYLEYGLEYFLITPLICGMTAAALLRVEAGEPPTVRSSLQRGFDLFTPLLAAAVLYLIAVVLGVFALFVGAIICAVRFWVVLPAVALDEIAPADAMRRAWELTRGVFWKTLGTLLAINLGPFVIGGIVSSVFTAAAKGADAQALQVVGTMVSQVLTGPFVVVAMSLMYFDLADRAAPDH